MKVLVTNKVHPLLITGLENLGYHVDYELETTNESIRNVIHGYAGVIINSKIKADKAFLNKGKKLKFIGRLGSGLEIIDIQYAAQLGIDVFNSPEGNCDAVAEHAIGMLLSLVNNLHVANEEVKAFQWHREKNRGIELGGKTIGIVGFGHTGQALAKKLQGWGMKILVHDIYKSYLPEGFSFVEQVGIKKIQEKADIISFHLPLSSETQDFCNFNFIEGCENQIIIVNTSRGSVVDTQAIATAIQNGKILGACLDVFENEKCATYTEEEHEMYRALFESPQVVVSPHIAGWTQESLEKIAQVLLKKIEKGTRYY